MRCQLCVCLLLVAFRAGAAQITLPPDLAPGDQYRLAFLTPSEISSAMSIAEFNSFVQSAADAVPEVSALGATWKAIASTPEIGIRENTGIDPDVETGVPIYLLNGRRIAADNADFWDGSHEGYIRVYPNGDFEAFGAEVMAGGLGPDLANIGNQINVGSIPSNFCSMGNCLPGETHPPQQVTSSDWIVAYDQPRGSYKMYAMSSVLTAVPEPSSGGSMLCGAIGLLLAVRHVNSRQHGPHQLPK